MDSRLEEHLKTHFGYNEFRHSQKEIVQAVLQRRDVLAILPTGAGKSICYQLPALLLPGTTVVISPLISLMQDQVISLSKNGLPAAFINSSLRYEDIQDVLNNIGAYKLLYLAPERLLDKDFLQILQRTPISLFAIDEAHCISQWGYSFRPEYRQLSILKTLFPQSSVVALTATATRDVERDISKQLAMRDPLVVRASFDRPNLSFNVQPKLNPIRQLLDFIDKKQEVSGIIYAATRKKVDEIYSELKQLGFQLGRYHAGLSDQERADMQHQFVHGSLNLMVATVAFGMGIHKPDIRYIVHVDMPRSIEQYYQEVGRAGRDGLPSECLMLYSAQELSLYELFLEQITDPQARQQMKAKTSKMYAFAQSAACRRKDLLRYFGEIYASPNCENCDNCLDDVEMVDITIPAQMILSCVYRLDQRFGAKYVSDVLRASRAKAILDRGHDRLSTYGLMKDVSETLLRDYIDRLIEEGYLARSEGEYPVLQWTSKTPQVIQGASKVLFRKRIETQRFNPAPSEPLPFDKGLFDELARLRKKIAAEMQVPAFVVFGDRSLMEMARAFPVTEKAFLAINGCGPIKWVKHGALFVEAIAVYRSLKN